MEKENNFPELIFLTYIFMIYITQDLCNFTYIVLNFAGPVLHLDRLYGNVRSGKCLEKVFKNSGN